jgi:hypothetical protein
MEAIASIHPGNTDFDINNDSHKTAGRAAIVDHRT